MRQYLELLKTVLAEGEWKENRTGVRTLSYPGAQMRFDLTQGFPAMTVRKLAFKASVGEMCGFLRGYNSAADFRALGCNVWNQNANENAEWLANPWREGEDHLGEIYGVQWRRWNALMMVPYQRTDDWTEEQFDRAFEGAGWSEVACDGGHSYHHKVVDQVGECVRKIMENPDDRRILFHGWNPAVLDQMALPPCHLLYQFHPNRTTRTISMTLYIRSNDLGLGAPFNVCGAAALLSFIGRLTGYEPKILTVQIGDAHIYENQLELVNELLTRTPEVPPTLSINPLIKKCETVEAAIDWLDKVHPSDFALVNYVYQETDITAPMAV